ncbi:MAG: hypothetical protein II393_01850 [Cytophagales bacterium]|nr:hypothetical protein [Cytophagales bacterium]
MSVYLISLDEFSKNYVLVADLPHRHCLHNFQEHYVNIYRGIKKDNKYFKDAFKIATNECKDCVPSIGNYGCLIM